MRLIRILFNWALGFILLIMSPLIFLYFFIAICIDQVVRVIKHNKKYLVDGTNWITEVFK